MSIVTVISLSMFFEVFNRFDRWIYDEATIAAQFFGSHPPRVLLIEVDTDYEGLSVNSWMSLIEQVHKYNPEVIAINILPWNWNRKDINLASQRFPLIIGSTHPELYAEFNNIVFSAIPPLDGNVYRQQRRFESVNEKKYQVLESAIHRKIYVEDNTDEGNFYINFMGGPGRLPVVSSKRVLEGGLVETLVKDKVILLGVKVPLMMDMPSPLGMMPFAHYQAYALDTLLNQNKIQIADIWLIIVLVSLVVFAMLLVVLKIPDRYQLLVISGFILSTLVISYICIVFFQYWIMTGYLLITEFSILIALLYLRNRQNQQALQSMALNSAARIESHWLSESFYSSDAHWNHIANMVTQTLSLERTIFLERVENDHRVREIKALNCGLEDISEMRRDYQRTPYTTAIEQGGALKLKHTYLEASADDEVQYLVPLNFAGNIQGFWAFTIKHDSTLDENKLIDAVEQFALQISELLYHRSEWEKNQQSQQSLVVKLMQMKFEESSYESINRSINFLTHRLSVMETLMDGLETSAILYDLFGRVVHVNKSMSHMLTGINLVPYSMSAVDLIVKLAGCSLIEARNYLSYLILEQGFINIPVKNAGMKSGHMLMVSALKNTEEPDVIEGEKQPFEITGVLCELIDMSQIREVYSQKEKVVEHMSGWLRNDLSSISMACDLSQDKRVSSDKRDQLLQVIKNKVMVLCKNFEKVNTIVQQDMTSRLTSQYPVDYIEALQDAVSESQKAHNKSVTINPVIPFCSPLVMAAPKELRQVFNAVIGILISDALDGSEIEVKIKCDVKFMEFKFTNQGFGIPQEQLQSYLHSHESLDSNEFQSLRLASHLIDNWGGQFEACSEIGEGMRFSFTLKSFQL